MRKGRLEAFSDGVVAILITIMVLELKVPHGTGIADLAGLLPLFLTYILSFVFLAIYLKGKLSPVLYIIAIPMGFVLQWLSEAIYVCVALLWPIPDKRIESKLMEKRNEETSIY